MVVCVVDVKNGVVSEPHVVATHQPLQTITSEANNRGKFDELAAEPYIISLLEQ